YALAQFKRKTESGRSFVVPTFDQLYRGHSVKRVVDLRGTELTRVIRKVFLLRQVLWIEDALPFFVSEPGCPDQDVVSHRHIAFNIRRSLRVRKAGTKALEQVRYFDSAFFRASASASQPRLSLSSLTLDR